MITDLARTWTAFADSSCRDYSPLYDRICRTVAASDDVLEMLAAAPPSAHRPNVLLAAVHYLVLGGSGDSLADVYSGTSEVDPGPLFVDFCRAHRREIEPLLAARHTNTNEVGRSAVLGPALTHVASHWGAPLALIDVGSSAGLNLLCDRYLLDYGEAGATGPPDSPVRLECQIVAGRPPIAPRLPPIAFRLGIDRHPVDVGDGDQARWQLACVWPDTGRLDRTRAAIDMARRHPVRVAAGDAVAEVGPAVAAGPPGSLPVVVTTWALAYLHRPERQRFVDALRAAAADRPLVWVSVEAAGVVPLLPGIAAATDDMGVEASVLGLVHLSGSHASAQVLGFAQPHGRWMDWRLEIGDRG
jgi:hypothetical protein